MYLGYFALDTRNINKNLLIYINIYNLIKFFPLNQYLSLNNTDYTIKSHYITFYSHNSKLPMKLESNTSHLEIIFLHLGSIHVDKIDLM